MPIHQKGAKHSELVESDAEQKIVWLVDNRRGKISINGKFVVENQPRSIEVSKTNQWIFKIFKKRRNENGRNFNAQDQKSLKINRTLNFQRKTFLTLFTYNIKISLLLRAQFFSNLSWNFIIYKHVDISLLPHVLLV